MKDVVFLVHAFASRILAMVFNEIENYLYIPVEQSPKPLRIRSCKILSTIDKKKYTNALTHEEKV